MSSRRRGAHQASAPVVAGRLARPSGRGRRHPRPALLSLLIATVGLGGPPVSWADARRIDPGLSPAPTAGPAATPLHQCRLLLSEHRTDRPLLTLALDPARPMAIVSFTHSVLDTPVSDHYWFKPTDDGWRAHLVEEHFDGSGYGLPHLAGKGETLTREGAGWRLQLDRVIDPLVILPLPAQRMRVRTPPDTREFLLGDLSTRSIQLRALDCPPR